MCEKRKIGNAEFSEDMAHYAFNFDKRLLKKNVWQICCPSSTNVATGLIPSNIFKKMVKSNARQLIKYNEKNASLLLQIVHTSFPLLKELWIVSNHIQNIEPIIKMYCPSILQLGLGDNALVHGRSLRKFSCIKLEKIFLDQNYLTDFNSLRECRIPQLKRLILQQKYAEISYVFSEDAFSQLAAWETKIFKQVVVNFQMRISQERSEKMLQQKSQYILNYLDLDTEEYD